VKVDVDEIISLCGACAPAFQARQSFDLPVMPFDWWILKLPEVVPQIENGLDNIFEDDVAQFGEYNSNSVLFSRFAIHVHDLPDEVMADKNDAWKSHLPALRARYSFLGRQLKERASRGDVLFIRSWIGEDEYLRDKFSGYAQDILSALRRVFQNDRIKLLMIDYNEPRLGEIDGVIVDNVTVYQRTNMGCNQGWREMFLRQGIFKRPAQVVLKDA